MRRLGRAFVVAVLIGTLLPGCGEAFAIASGIGLAVGTGRGQPGEGLLSGATCGLLAEAVWFVDCVGRDRDDYDDSFFFWPKSVKHDIVYGHIVAGGVFFTAALLIEPENVEIREAAVLIGVGVILIPLWYFLDTRYGGKASTRNKSRRTALLLAPTGVGVACRF